MKNVVLSLLAAVTVTTACAGRSRVDSAIALARQYAMPDSAYWNPVRADSLFKDARMRGGAGKLSEQDERLHALVREVIRGRDEREGHERMLRSAIARAQDEAEALRSQRAQLAYRLDATAEDRQRLTRAIEMMESQLRDKEIQLESLRLELDRLKAIDLSPPARTPNESGAPSM